MAKRNLVIVGASAFAEVAWLYFKEGGKYNIKGFSVEKKYLEQTRMFGLPVVPFEEIEKAFPPNDHDVFVAVVYTEMNRLRTRLMNESEAKGYVLASYISDKAFVASNVEIGKHCFIFENNVIQPFTKIGSNSILWSGNHIGHHSKIENNCFISSHVVISGYSVIKSNVFMGVNSSCADTIIIEKNNWIGPNCCITRNTQPDQIFRATPAEASKISSLRFFKVKD